MTCIKRWKLTNEAETHNGLRYHGGLVVDPLPFNDDPEDSCCPGGIYFAGRDTLAFIEGMTWAREVSLPPQRPRRPRPLLPRKMARRQGDTRPPCPYRSGHP